MHLFFTEMLKYDSTISITNGCDDQQLQLNIDAMPTNEKEFTKYFSVTQDLRPMNTQPHIIVSCHLMSNCTIREIKFDTTKTTKFIDWLSKEKIFLESDSLGISKTFTIRYLLKIHPHITNCTSLKMLLQEELSNVVLDPHLAVKLDPSQKTQQEDAMSNRDMFIPALPSFKIYKMCLSYGCDNNQVKTNVFGIKCAQEKA